MTASVLEQLHSGLAEMVARFPHVPSFLIGALTSAVLFVVQRQIAKWSARRKMMQRNFLDRINVSLNIVRDEKLRIRTLFERPLDAVIHNPHVAEQLRIAALAASKSDDCIVQLPAEESWFVQNCILNAIAERFGRGAFRVDAGATVATATYLFWLTCEPVKRQRERKLRVFLIREELLTAFPYMETMPKLETEKHEDRVLALRHASRAFHERPGLFSRVEVYV
jgi:hypothetical protein